jgi:glutathione S-transferase
LLDIGATPTKFKGTIMYKLVIGNKRYSSWSMRPWTTMRMLDIAFEEIVIPLDTPTFKNQVAKYSTAGTVPVLMDGNLAIWDTLSIVEYLADAHPDKNLWPTHKAPRAMARSMCAEMHAGFMALRSACPVNLGKKFHLMERGAKVDTDIARISELFTIALRKYGDSGDFLFGEFGAVDGYFAPVIVRLRYHGYQMGTLIESYIDAVLGTAAFQEWNAAALKEEWIVEADELDEKAKEVLT